MQIIDIDESSLRLIVVAIDSDAIATIETPGEGILAKGCETIAVKTKGEG